MLLALNSNQLTVKNGCRLFWRTLFSVNVWATSSYIESNINTHTSVQQILHPGGDLVQNVGVARWIHSLDLTVYYPFSNWIIRNVTLFPQCWLSDSRTQHTTNYKQLYNKMCIQALAFRSAAPNTILIHGQIWHKQNTNIKNKLQIQQKVQLQQRWSSILYYYRILLSQSMADTEQKMAYSCACMWQ